MLLALRLPLPLNPQGLTSPIHNPPLPPLQVVPCPSGRLTARELPASDKGYTLVGVATGPQAGGAAAAAGGEEPAATWVLQLLSSVALAAVTEVHALCM